MNEHPSRISETKKRFVALIFGKKIIFFFAAAATLIVLFYAEENWRGWRAWEKFKQDAKSRGCSIEVSDLIPPEVSDADNFAKTPLLKLVLKALKDPKAADASEYKAFQEKMRSLRLSINGQFTANRQKGALGDLRAWYKYKNYLDQQKLNPASKPPAELSEEDAAREVLRCLKSVDSELAELTTAVQKPRSRFPLRYEEGLKMMILHVGPLRDFGRMFAIRATARLKLGQTDEALADVVACLRLGETLREEPVIMSQLVRMAIYFHAEGVIWEGLAERKWTDVQLAILEKELRSINFLSEYPLSLRMDGGSVADYMERKVLTLNPWERGKVFSPLMTNGDNLKWGRLPSLLKTVFFALLPKGIYYQNMIANREYIEAGQNFTKEGRINVAKLRKSKGFSNPYNFLSRAYLATPLEPFTVRTAYVQMSVDLARVACALERYRYAHQAYPDTLEALTPAFIEQLPCDRINGEPLKYRRTQDGCFVLYSVGWNEVDDGGQPACDKMEQGDWVWSYPVN
jgi:hypothetical protein